MKLWAALVCATSLGVPAAEITRVASSFEDKKPFGMFLDFTFDRVADKGRVAREWYEQQGTLKDVTELRYQKYETSLGIDVSLGVFRDLELRMGAPIIFQSDRAWNLAAGTDLGTSTLVRNCSNARGDSCATPGKGSGERLWPRTEAVWAILPLDSAGLPLCKKRMPRSPIGRCGLITRHRRPPS
jgi:hypothetical protein